jgi:hypothetical protein
VLHLAVSWNDCAFLLGGKEGEKAPKFCQQKKKSLKYSSPNKSNVLNVNLIYPEMNFKHLFQQSLQCELD